MTAAATAYERLITRLSANRKAVRDHVNYATAQSAAHEDRDPSLAIYREPGRAKVFCWVGCSDALDILPALGLGVRDLFDTPNGDRRQFRPDPAIEARIAARRTMTPSQRVTARAQTLGPLHTAR